MVNIEFLGNTALSRVVAQQFDKKLVSYEVKRFSDGESYADIELGEELEDKHVLLFAQFAYDGSSFVNDQFMSFLLMADQLKKNGVTNITAILPYFPYSRQDKNILETGVGGVSLIGKLCKAAGISEIICCDLHTDSIKKHFAIPIHSLGFTSLWLEQLEQYNKNDICLVAPDQGSKKRVQKLAQQVGCAFAYVEKYRPKQNTSIVRKLVGSVIGKKAIIIDDILDTGGTAINACRVLRENKVAGVHGFFTHGILSGQAVQKLAASPFEKIILTDTIVRDIAGTQEICSTVSTAGLLAHGIEEYFAKHYVTSAQVTNQHETTKATSI